MHEARDAFLTQIRPASGGWPDFEGMIQAIYAAFLRPGDCAVDVGVNEGQHFVALARAVGASGHVIGVEASPALSQSVERSMHLFCPELWARVRLHTTAVTDQEGEAILHFDTRHSGLSSLAAREVSPAAAVEEVRVRTTRLDTLVDRPVAFMKLDIEGAEYHALRGAVRTLQRRPLLAFEFDPTSPSYFGYAPGDLVDLLKAHGYGITDLFGHPPSDGGRPHAMPDLELSRRPGGHGRGRDLRPGAGARVGSRRAQRSGRERRRSCGGVRGADRAADRLRALPQSRGVERGAGDLPGGEADARRRSGDAAQIVVFAAVIQPASLEQRAALRIVEKVVRPDAPWAIMADEAFPGDAGGRHRRPAMR